MNNTRLPYLRDKTKTLPLEPGVYIMRDAGGKIIYVGKAKALRNRVSSYFRSVEKHLPKVYQMVGNAYDFETIITGSEFEALVLECSLIKQHRPKYNILLKDDKGYHYIRVSEGDYPRIYAAMQRVEDGSRYIGPYTSSFVVKETVEEVNRAFLLPTCTKRFPEDFRKGRPCLNYHIKQCMGLCSGKIPKADYDETVEQALGFIQGNAGDTLRLLEQRMEQHAENLEFEKAAACRDRIKAIGRLKDHQSVVFARIANQDVIAVARGEGESCAAVIKFREQRLVDKQDYFLGEIESLETARRDFLLGYYNSGSNEIPRQISLDGECEDAELVARFLTGKLGRRVLIHVPERGEQLKFVKMAASNAAQQLASQSERTGREVAALDELARLLGLASTPVYIEAYDISNYGEQTKLGGMVVFENGRPRKSAYKKFNIKTVEGTDDYASMREVISRRLNRYLEEKESGEGFGRLPDLILLDGGKGHVSAVQPILDEMGLQIPLYGMVKDGSHRTRAIARDGGETAIAGSRSAFTLVSKIQDEVHRFSITAMKKKHSINAFTLRLTEIPGIGEKRAAALLRHFKTQKALKEATAAELAEAPGLSKASAERVFEAMHADEDGKREQGAES